MKISEIIIACFNIKEMETFYQNVFNIDFKTSSILDRYIYSGNIRDLQLTLCPASIANISAKDNRHQLTFTTRNIRETLQKVTIYKGQVIQEIKEREKVLQASIQDVDGNSIVLKEILPNN